MGICCKRFALIYLYALLNDYLLNSLENLLYFTLIFCIEEMHKLKKMRYLQLSESGIVSCTL